MKDVDVKLNAQEELILNGPIDPMPDFSKYRKLKRLTWHDGGWQSVAEVLSNIHLAFLLTYLDLSRTTEVCDLSHALQYSSLVKWNTHDRFVAFSQLDHLNLRGAIYADKRFIQWLFQRVQVRYLNLSCTGLTNMGRLLYYMNVETLDVSNNFLSSATPFTDQNNYLRRLDISYNELTNTEVEKLTQNTNLHHLVAAPQRIHHVDPNTVQFIEEMINKKATQEPPKTQENPVFESIEPPPESEMTYVKSRDLQNVFESYPNLYGLIIPDLPDITHVKYLSRFENLHNLDIPLTHAMMLRIQRSPLNKLEELTIQIDYKSTHFVPREFGKYLSLLPNLYIVKMKYLPNQRRPDISYFLKDLFHSKSLLKIYGLFYHEQFLREHEIKMVKRALKKNQSIEYIGVEDMEDSLDDDNIFLNDPKIKQHFLDVRAKRQRLQMIVPLIAAMQLTGNQRHDLIQMTPQIYHKHPHRESVLDVMPMIQRFLGNPPTERKIMSRVVSQIEHVPGQKRLRSHKDLPTMFQPRQRNVQVFQGDTFIQRFDSAADALKWIMQHGNKLLVYSIDVDGEQHHWYFTNNKWSILTR